MSFVAALLCRIGWLQSPAIFSSPLLASYRMTRTKGQRRKLRAKNIPLSFFLEARLLRVPSAADLHINLSVHASSINGFHITSLENQNVSTTGKLH